MSIRSVKIGALIDGVPSVPTWTCIYIIIIPGFDSYLHAVSICAMFHSTRVTDLLCVILSLYSLFST